MDSGDLKVFAAVARLGGMNRAAAALNTVQSNVTARIQQLEATLGVPLFHRHSRGVGLTDAGRRLLPYAERAALLLAEARRAVADDGTPKGGLAVGAMETTTALRLPAVLAAYAAAHPAVDLVLRTGTTCELTQAVLEHRLEGALVCGPVDHPELEARPAFREELVLVAARHLAGPDVLAGRPELKIIVFRAGCSYRQKLESLLAGRGVADPRRLEFGTLDGILGCVAAGVGVTLLPRGVVAAAAREGRVALHELPDGTGLVDTVFIRRRDGYLSSALAAFIAHAAPAAAPRADAAE